MVFQDITRRRGVEIAGLVVAALLAFGCDSVQHPDPLNEIRAVNPSSRVATVNGVAIGVDEFEEYWAHHPELTRTEVLDALTARAAVISDGLTRSRGTSPSVVHERKQAMVRALVRDFLLELEDSSEIPDPEPGDFVDAYAAMGEPRGFRISQLVVYPLEPNGPPEVWSAARASASELLDTLDEDATSFDLVELIRGLELDENLGSSIQLHFTFRDLETDQYFNPPGWSGAVEELVQQVRVLASEDRRMVEEPIETRFGWHIVVLEEVIAGHEPDQDDIREYAHARAAQRFAGQKITERILQRMRESTWTINPSLLSGSEESSP